MFVLGKKYREPSLPNVIVSLLQKMFTPENLCTPEGSSISIPSNQFTNPPSELSQQLVDQINSQETENNLGSTVEYILDKVAKNSTMLNRSKFTRFTKGTD